MKAKSLLLVGVLFLSLLSNAQPSIQLQDDELKTIPVNNQTRKEAIRRSVFNFRNLFDFVPGTNSEQLSWLHAPSTQTEAFLQKAKNETQQFFAKNSEYEKINTFMAESLVKKNDKEFSVKISETRSLVVSNDQFKRTFIDIDQGQSTEIISTDVWAPKKAAFVGLYASPLNSYVAALVNIDGSIDNSQLLVYDLQNKKIVLNAEVNSSLEDQLWFSDNQVMYNHPLSSSHGAALIIQNVANLQKRSLINYGTVHFEKWVGYSDYATQDLFVKNLNTGEQLVYKDISATDVAAEDGNYFYLMASRSAKFNGQILKLKKSSFSTVEVFADKIAGYNLDNVSVITDKLIVGTYSRDSRVMVVAYDSSGKLISQLTLPDTLSVTEFGLAEAADAIKLSIKAPFTTGEVIWKINEGNPDFTAILKDALRGTDIEIVTSIESFKSADGELIPARVSYKKGLAINGNCPVFMETYGGFNLMGYLSPSFGKFKKEFMKRGGILVGTGVRGGAERGYEWFKAGSGVNELNTTLDVIAIADGLVKNGYTQSDKIVLTGTSNGGYVVANAAMTSPQSFGLVIPINGVQDQLGFPFMDRWGVGWQSEYMNPYEASEFSSIYPRAPLENIATAVHKPFLMIVNGEQDTRVNKIHSYKLKTHLDNVWPGQSILYSVENAGHWATSPYLLDDIGVSANAHVWATIFAHVGMQF